jgi:hypothetical protein
MKGGQGLRRAVFGEAAGTDITFQSRLPIVFGLSEVKEHVCGKKAIV